MAENREQNEELETEDIEQNSVDEFEMQQELQRQQLAERQTGLRARAVGVVKTAGKEIVKKQVKKFTWSIILKSPIFWGAMFIILGIFVIFGIIALVAAVQDDPCIFGGVFSELIGEACDVVQDIIQ